MVGGRNGSCGAERITNHEVNPQQVQTAMHKHNQGDRKRVVSMKPDMEKIIEVLISLLEEQEKVEITYTIEKTA